MCKYNKVRKKHLTKDKAGKTVIYSIYLMGPQKKGRIKAVSTECIQFDIKLCGKNQPCHTHRFFATFY